MNVFKALTNDSCDDELDVASSAGPYWNPFLTDAYQTMIPRYPLSVTDEARTDMSAGLTDPEAPRMIVLDGARQVTPGEDL